MQERDVAGNGKVAAAVIGRAVENQQDVLSGKSARHYIEEGLKACGIRGWHNQIDASAILGRDSAVQIDVFADELGGHVRPHAHGCPAGPYAFKKASRSALIVSASVVGMPCGKPL